MKIFIDSADLDEIKQAFEWGVADGVTTNPSLLKKAVEKRKEKGEKVDIKSYLAEILKVAKGTPVSLEVTKTDAKGMAEQGRKLFKMFNPVANNVYIKIPVNPAFKEDDKTHFDGIEAIRELSKEKIPVNCTLIFTPEQALLAAKAGAKFLSPFAGRIDDLIRTNAGGKFDKTEYYPMEGKEEKGDTLGDNGVVSGIDLVRQCVQIIEQYRFESEVLAASLRNPRQVRESALVGAHIATLPFEVIKDMLKHPKTYEGMDSFTKDIVPEYEEL
ncbi:transaldolase [Candidatus Woesearchaeota archaeon]|nr:transaldolase [Candidatus Woesearchaeota archaeon]